MVKWQVKRIEHKSLSVGAGTCLCSPGFHVPWRGNQRPLFSQMASEASHLSNGSYGFDVHFSTVREWREKTKEKQKMAL